MSMATYGLKRVSYSGLLHYNNLNRAYRSCSFSRPSYRLDRTFLSFSAMRFSSSKMCLSSHYKDSLFTIHCEREIILAPEHRFRGLEI